MNPWRVGGSIPFILAACILAACLTASAQTTRPASQPSAGYPPASGPASQPEDRPSFLFLFTSDQSGGMTGFEGNRNVQTPNLDRLAAEGAYFSRCYTPTPQSAPARASVLTGLYPHSHGVTSDTAALPPRTDTFTVRLKKGGYACGLVGQWCIPAENNKEPNLKEPGFGLTDYVATDNGKWTGAETWINGRKGQADKYLTDWEADRGIEFLEKFHDRPFFLWLCFRAPHDPLEYPPGDASRYPPDSMRQSETLQANTANRPIKLSQSPIATRFNTKRNDLKGLLQDRSKYAAMISRVDRNVGRVLEELDRLDLARNTVVVFACSNGYALGDHGLYGTGPAFYEEMVRGPLLVRVPGLTQPKTKIDRLVGLVDLAPTFLELAGLSRPWGIQGESLVPLLDGSAPAGRADEKFFEYERQTGDKQPGEQDYPCQVRGMVTKNYKFVDYLDGGFVFYDLKRDPGEMNNLSRRNSGPSNNAEQGVDTHYISIVKVLQTRLSQWRKQTRDSTLR